LDAFDEGDLPQQGWRPWLFGLSPARETMAVLQVGVLDEVVETKEGLVVWPAGTTLPKMVWLMYGSCGVVAD
jgi:hypothetical protein